MTSPAKQSGLLDKAERFGRFVENTSLALVLLAMVALAAAQIVMRSVFSTSLSWSGEALQLMVLWIMMLGAVAATRERRHIVIDVLSRVLPANWRAWAAFVVDGFSAGVVGVLAWHSVVFVRDSKAFGDLLLNDLPAWPFQLILPVAFAMMAYRYGVWSLLHLRDIARTLSR